MDCAVDDDKLTRLRGLAFTALALRRSLDHPNEELAVSFTQAYGETLKKYHSFVVKPLFTVCTPQPLHATALTHTSSP